MTGVRNAGVRDCGNGGGGFSTAHAQPKCPENKKRHPVFRPGPTDAEMVVWCGGRVRGGGGGRIRVRPGAGCAAVSRTNYIETLRPFWCKRSVW